MNDEDRFWLEEQPEQGELFDREALRPARELIDKKAVEKMAGDIVRAESERAAADKADEVQVEEKYVFRVRYLLNTIEVLDLVKMRKRSGHFVVRDELGAETTISNHDVFKTFRSAKMRLVQLNEEKVSMVKEDLRRAEDRLGISRSLSVDE